jgi:hypothetical protein
MNTGQSFIYRKNHQKYGPAVVRNFRHWVIYFFASGELDERLVANEERSSGCEKKDCLVWTVTQYEVPNVRINKCAYCRHAEQQGLSSVQLLSRHQECRRKD